MRGVVTATPNPTVTVRTALDVPDSKCLCLHFEEGWLLTTCFDGSETPLPSGYTKGRHLRVTAFSRSIASCGNDIGNPAASRSLLLATPRDSRRAIRRRPDGPISAKTLGCLCVARGLG